MSMGGGDCLKYLKRGWNRKEGRGNKNFEKGGQAGSRGGCLKKWGWNPLMNYGSGNIPVSKLLLNISLKMGAMSWEIILIYRFSRKTIHWLFPH